MQAFSLVLFGATGDLAKIKILPSIYTMFEQNLLPGDFSLIGSGRTAYMVESFRDYVKKVLTEKFGEHLQPDVIEKMLKHTYYFSGDTEQIEFYKALGIYLDELKAQGVPCANRIYHLAILPHLYPSVVKNLGEAGLSQRSAAADWVRILVEKPFGEDEKSAIELNKLLTKYFPEKDIFRLDHYLGKETVMNILAFRFGNGLLEPIWNHKFIDHIQIHSSENFGVKKRGKFYDVTGALKDFVQNHLLQVLATTLMDRPDDFSVAKVQAKRAEILSSIQKYKPSEIDTNVITGQYHGYLDEQDIPASSQTETYVALKVMVNKSRWQGVPIYIRSGKMLNDTISEVSIVFKRPNYKIFENEMAGTEIPNVLHLRLQPHEGIVLQLAVKKPGPKMVLTPASMDFFYDRYPGNLLEAYVKLLIDAFNGDQTNYARLQEVVAQWQFVDPILKHWETKGKHLHEYKPDSWGPQAADLLLSKDRRSWLDPTSSD